MKKDKVPFKELKEDLIRQGKAIPREYKIFTSMGQAGQKTGCCKCNDLFRPDYNLWFFYEVGNEETNYFICYNCVFEVWMAGGRMYIPEYKGFCKSMPDTPQPTVFTLTFEEIKKYDRMCRLLAGQPILDDTFKEEERKRLIDEIGPELLTDGHNGMTGQICHLTKSEMLKKGR